MHITKDIMTLHIGLGHNYNNSRYQCDFCNDEFFSDHTDCFKFLSLRNDTKTVYLFNVNLYCIKTRAIF